MHFKLKVRWHHNASFKKNVLMKILVFKLTNINIDFAKIFLFNCKIDFIEISKFKIVFYDKTNGHLCHFIHASTLSTN